MSLISFYAFVIQEVLDEIAARLPVEDCSVFLANDRTRT